MVLGLLFSALAMGPISKDPKGVAAKMASLAGGYYFGDGLGVNCSLELDAAGAFKFEWDGCLGVYDRNEGAYSFEGDELVLQPTHPNRRDGFRGTATRFYPIRWGGREYMIAEEDMLGFCSKISHGWKGDELFGRSGFFFVRRTPETDSHRPWPALEGRPPVPAVYKSALEHGFSSRVLSVSGKKRVRIDKGRLDGVTLRTRLAPTRFENWVSVVAVSDHSAVCELWDPKDRAPKAGTTLQAVEW